MQRTAVSRKQLIEELSRFLATTMKTSQVEVFRIVDELDLTMTQLKMLWVLDGSQNELTPSELARLVGLSPAATGRAADALTRQGIVSRREDERDRRVKRLALTDAGRDIVSRIAAARREGLNRLVGSLDAEQREALSAAIAPLLTSSSSGPDCAAGA